jgi:hypothetical protein
MNNLEASILLLLGSTIAGLIGSLTGLGGGFLLVPLMTLGFGVDIHHAAGASLISIIATSSGASAAYVKDGFSNIRIGLLLETATTLGAIAGVFVAASLSSPLLKEIFGWVLLISAFLSNAPLTTERLNTSNESRAAKFFQLDGSYPSLSGIRSYTVHQVGWGYMIMAVAGLVSGMLGIGAGTLKVLAMDKIMQLPMKVSLTTCNFMIGVTACASAGIYFHMGYINPVLAMPVIIGGVGGSVVGAGLLPKIHSQRLRMLFSAVLVIIGLQMILS